jgi:hypothetical protein
MSPSEATANVREAMERQRRADLHRQIGALTAAAEKLARDPGVNARRKYHKVISKIRRKERELLQPMLMFLTG